MSWIYQNIHWILIVSGLGTFAVMLPMVFAPRGMVRILFGEEIAAPSALFIARGWGWMVVTSGLLLVYAAGIRRRGFRSCSIRSPVSFVLSRFRLRTAKPISSGPSIGSWRRATQ